MVDLLVITALIGGVYFTLCRLGKQKSRNNSQALLDYKEIHVDGIIEMTDLRFRLVIEVEPVNESLKSLREKQSLWLGFRSLVQTINIPFTLKIETRFLDLREYLNNIKACSESKDLLLRDYGLELSGWLNKKTENRQNRDRRYYIILKIDSLANGIESGVKTGNPMLNSLISSLTKLQKTSMSDKDLQKMAIDELKVMAGVVRSSLEGMDIVSRQLNKEEVLDMIYSTFNRDLAPHCQVSDADKNHMFSLFMTSQTPELFLEGINYVMDEEEKKRIS